MKFNYEEVCGTVHRLIPSRYPTVTLFDWADSEEELIAIAKLEGLTNDRLIEECGAIQHVTAQDWVSGEGATALMSAFTHIGHPSRFSDGTFGIYYAADSAKTAIEETKYHRERFLSASKERPCAIQMREYKCKVTQPLVSLFNNKYKNFFNPDPQRYPISQQFGRTIKKGKEWGLIYNSVRRANAQCVAIFRPPAVTMPAQGGHFDYIWDGQNIVEVRKSVIYSA